MARYRITTLFLLALTWTTSAAADDKKPDRMEVRGTVVNVLGDRLVIDADEPARKMEIDAAHDATVTIGGETGELKSLRPGMRVAVTRGKDGKAVAISAEKENYGKMGSTREAKGAIRRATPAGAGTRLMLESDAGEVYTYRVPADSKVTVGSESAEADALAPGMSVTLTLDQTGAVREVRSHTTEKHESDKGEVPGLTPGRSSERYEVAGGYSTPFAGSFEGTFALGPVLGYDAGQQSDDSGYVRPLFRDPLHPWTRNVLPRKEAFRRAGQVPGQPDPYVEAFLRNDGTGDPYPNAPNEVPGYPAWYWSHPSSRYLPLGDRYRHDFRFGLGEQEPRTHR